MLFVMSGCPGCGEKHMANKTLPFDILNQSRLLPSSAAESGLIPVDDINLGPQGYWIRSEAGFNRLGYQTPAEDLDNNLNKTDWTKQDLFIVTLGVQGTTGHEIRFETIELNQDVLRISIQHLEPTGAVGEALTHPTGIVRIDKQQTNITSVLNIDGKDVVCDWHILE